MARTFRTSHSLSRLPTRTGDLANVVIETPKGQPNKLRYDADAGTMRLSKVLPVGMVFPFDFGFLPRTKASDGDPLDVLVLMDAPVYPGCIVGTRLIGVLRCEQCEAGGEPIENDRLIGVANDAKTFGATKLRDLDPQLLKEIEAFFVDYNRVNGREFRVVRAEGRRAALRTARAGRTPSDRRR